MANTDDLIREATRNGEEYLRAQMQIALAADQRGISLGAIFVAAASVVLGFLLTDVGALAKGFSYVCLFLSFGLVIAAVLAFYSARPIPIWVLGNRPSNWDQDIENEKPIQEAMKEHNRHLDEQIADNNKILGENAFLLKCGMAIAAGAVFISIVWGLRLVSG